METRNSSPQPEQQAPANSWRGRWLLLIIVFLMVAVLALAVAALLVNIAERKAEARHTFNWLSKVDEDTTDAAEWGKTFPSQFDGYKRTSEATRTKYGGHGGSDALPAERLDRDPWLKRLYAGYAFSLDYRDRRGHAYMLYDQEQTERVTKRPQPGACLSCHSSVMPAFRFLGEGDVFKGFEALCAMPYLQAHDLTDAKGQRLIRGPISCVDCHDPRNMELRLTRPAFVRAIQAFAAGDQPAPFMTSVEIWRKGDRERPYDVNALATRQERRSFVCAQCHVEYYFQGERKTLAYPWSKGLKADQVEQYYDEAGFADWTHGETGAQVVKAQHPEFELWNQGIHARSGVACADCHMPYKREGAVKVSDHWVRSPLTNINRACQVCHHFEEKELLARAEAIQDRNHALLERAGKALTDFLDAVKAAREAGAGEAQLKAACSLQRKAQWRVDFVYTENSMGFHAPQEAARLLGEAIDYFRQGQVEAIKQRPPR